MPDTKTRVKIGEATVKVTMEPIYAFLNKEENSKKDNKSSR